MSEHALTILGAFAGAIFGAIGGVVIVMVYLYK